MKAVTAAAAATAIVANDAGLGAAADVVLLETNVAAVGQRLVVEVLFEMKFEVELGLELEVLLAFELVARLVTLNEVDLWPDLKLVASAVCFVSLFVLSP